MCGALSKYAKYTVEMFCKLGTEDDPDHDEWLLHKGKGQAAAGTLAKRILSATYVDDARAIRREIVDEIPQWLTEIPIFADDPDPEQELIERMLAARRELQADA